MTAMTAIATARNTDRFTDASLYDVTYVGHNSMDAGVRWEYLRHMARRGTIRPEIICRNHDGSDAGRRTI